MKNAIRKKLKKIPQLVVTSFEKKTRKKCDRIILDMRMKND